MPDLPTINPDESGDVPRCKKECPSFDALHHVGECRGVPYDFHSTVCRAEDKETVLERQICQPRLLRSYAELREIKARRCETCDCYDYPASWCNLNGCTMSETDVCREGWEHRP